MIYYIILRNGVEHFRGKELNFMDTSDIQPYQEYSYFLRACTVAGCSDSSTVGKSFNNLVTAYLLLHHVVAAFRWEPNIWKINLLSTYVDVFRETLPATLCCSPAQEMGEVNQFDQTACKIMLWIFSSGWWNLLSELQRIGHCLAWKLKRKKKKSCHTDIVLITCISSNTRADEPAALCTPENCP